MKRILIIFVIILGIGIIGFREYFKFFCYIIGAILIIYFLIAKYNDSSYGRKRKMKSYQKRCQKNRAKWEEMFEKAKEYYSNNDEVNGDKLLKKLISYGYMPAVKYIYDKAISDKNIKNRDVMNKYLKYLSVRDSMGIAVSYARKLFDYCIPPSSRNTYINGFSSKSETIRTSSQSNSRTTPTKNSTKEQEERKKREEEEQIKKEEEERKEEERRHFKLHEVRVSCRVTGTRQSYFGRDVVSVSVDATYIFRNCEGKEDTKTTVFSLSECNPSLYEYEALQHAKNLGYMTSDYRK